MLAFTGLVTLKNQCNAPIPDEAALPAVGIETILAVALAVIGVLGVVGIMPLSPAASYAMMGAGVAWTACSLAFAAAFTQLG